MDLGPPQSSFISCRELLPKEQFIRFQIRFSSQCNLIHINSIDGREIFSMPKSLKENLLQPPLHFRNGPFFFLGRATRLACGVLVPGSRIDPHQPPPPPSPRPWKCQVLTIEPPGNSQKWSSLNSRKTNSWGGWWGHERSFYFGLSGFPCL